MHSDISARSRALKRESQQLLGLGDHLNALRKISKAIAMATKEPIDFQIGLLNLRAEALIKHAKLNLALVDAKAMITLDPSSDAGYLRAGQILRLLQRADDAAGNYRLGLERAADKTRLWPAIYAFMAESPAYGPRDPFRYPPEITAMIFGYLRLRDLTDCCLVSKAWRDRVRSNSLLWQDLDFPRPLRLQDRARVKRCVQLAGAGRTRLRMVGHEDVVREAYKPGFKLPENIWSLTLLHEHTVITSGVMMKQWGFLGERIAKSTALRVLEISCAMSATQLIALMDKFRSLEVLQLGNIIVDRGTGPDIKLGDQQYGLRSLRMGILDYDELVPVGNSLMQQMFAQNLGLETVELKAMLRKPRRNRTAQLDLRMLSGLQRIRFFDSSLMDVPALPPSVRILDLENSSFEEFKYHSSDSETMLPYLPRLEYFHCTRAPSMGTGNHYIKILRRAHTDGVSNLKSLRLISNQDYHIPLLPEALGAMTVPNLQHITLGNELMVTDDVLDVITNRCPALQSLDLEKSAVTGAGVLRLIRTREGTLRRLNLTDCSAKVSADVVGYARELGIQVDYANTGEPGKCKTWTGYAFDPDLLTA